MPDQDQTKRDPAVALASLPLGIPPANAAKVSEGTASSIEVIEASSNAKQFNLGNLGVQSVAIYDGRVATSGSGRNGGGGGFRSLLKLLDFLGVVRTDATENVIFPTTE